VATVPGATLTPHFRDFLPGWVARQPWYEGPGSGRLAMVGSFRLEDRDGAVGLETHLLGDGAAVYQVPMTYRDAPLPGAPDPIATAVHSVLGRRWIYDATADPVWVRETLALVAAGGAADPERGGATARGHLVRTWPRVHRAEDRGDPGAPSGTLAAGPGPPRRGDGRLAPGRPGRAGGRGLPGRRALRTACRSEAMSSVR
jgi:hypothetical protein